MKPKLFWSGAELVALGDATLTEAQQRLTGCEACSWSASLPFDTLLRELLRASAMTEYFLGEAIECPRCESLIFEKTLVEVDGRTRAAMDLLEYIDARDNSQEIVFIDESRLSEAQDLIVGCEHCAEQADLLFDQVLDAVTGCDPTTTEYLLCRPAKCGFCNREVVEKTLVVAR